MQILTPPDARERVGFFVPRWTSPEEGEVQGTLFRAMPVAGALYNAGYEVVFVDQELDLDLDDRRDEIREALAGVDVVFLWMNELWPATQTINSLGIANMLRSWLPDVRIAVGGAFIAVCEPEMLFVDGPVDVFIRGYGEHACPMYVDALRGRARLDEVPGMVWRDESGFRANDTIYEAIGEENNAVMYRLLDMGRYIHRRGGIFGNAHDTLTIGTGQGCGKRCTFCYWRNNRPSLFSAESIVDTAEHMFRTHGVRQFHLADLDFFMNLHRPRELARLWAERLPECHWFTLCSLIDALKLTPDDWALLAAGGCRKLEFGTETGAPEMLTAIGKRHSPEDIVTLTARALEHGIE